MGSVQFHEYWKYQPEVILIGTTCEEKGRNTDQNFKKKQNQIIEFLIKHDEHI